MNELTNICEMQIALYCRHIGSPSRMSTRTASPSGRKLAGRKSKPKLSRRR